jgi:copper chaperone
VRSAVSNLDGVQSVEVEGSGETQITFDTSKTSLEEVEKIITDLGYEIRK